MGYAKCCKHDVAEACLLFLKSCGSLSVHLILFFFLVTMQILVLIGVNFDVLDHAVVCQTIDVFFCLAVATSLAASLLWQGKIRHRQPMFDLFASTSAYC